MNKERRTNQGRKLKESSWSYLLSSVTKFLTIKMMPSLRGGGISPSLDVYHPIRILSAADGQMIVEEGTTSLSFRICVGIILSLQACVQLLVAVYFIRNRTSKLCSIQPHFNEALKQYAWYISLFVHSNDIHRFASSTQSTNPSHVDVFASSVATLSAYLFAFPENDIACASRQPIIFTSLSLIGTLLSTRAWRIGSILAPAADFASSAGGGEIPYGGNNNSSRSKLTIERAHTVAMNILTSLSTLSIACGKSRRITLGGGGKGIRRQIDTTQLLFVTVILMMPQLILQVLNVAIPIMRATSTKRPIVPFVIGVVLIAIPFFLALLLNTSEGSSWQIFQEYEMIKSSVLIALTVLVVTIPSMLMPPTEVEIPNLTAFLQTASLLGLALPLFYQIAFVKSISIRTKSFDNSKDVLLRRNSSDSTSSQMNDDAVKISAAEEAMTMAKMLGHMGSDAFHKTLSFFKLQGKYSIQVRCG